MGNLTFSGNINTEVVLNPWIFAGAAIFSFVTVYLSSILPCRIASRVSAVEAVRYTEGQDEKAGGKKKKVVKKTRRVHPREMALQNIKRNKKKVVVVVASLSLALVLLNCIYGLVNGSDSVEVMKSCREERRIDGKVFGVDRMVMEKLENPEGELDWEKYAEGKYVIATRYSTLEEEMVNFFLPGEMVTVTNENGEMKEYEVMAVADIPIACRFRHYGMFECNFILPEKEYHAFMGEAQPMRTIFNVKAEYEEDMEEWLADYCENVNPELQYTSKATIVAEFDGHKNMYAMVGSLLSFILAMIGILNFINTMVTSVLSRKQEF